MNASYKIVLLGAFVLFAAVVGYYVLSSPGTEEASGSQPSEPLAKNQAKPDTKTPEPGPQATRTQTPPPRTGLDRPGLDRTPPPRPANEITIDSPSDETGGIRFNPQEAAGTPAERVALDPGADTGEPGTGRPGPGTDHATTPTPDNPTPGTGTGNTRPGPGSDPAPADTQVDDADTAETETKATPQPQPETPQPAPRDTGNRPRTYTVQPGDTFASIAVKVYGEESAWFSIAQANPSVDPKRLQVDQVIILPDRDAAERKTEEPTPPAPGKDQSYTVRPGDNLSRIAQRFYGDTEAWDLIYNRNRDKIGPTPDNLKVGMVLIIPQAYNGAQ